MGNYIGGLSGIEQPLAQWENIWGTVEDNRQRRWLNNETRTALDRENRRQRDLSQVELDAQARRAGLFTGADDRLSGLSRQNVPNATASATPSAAATSPVNLTPTTAGVQEPTAAAQAPQQTMRNASLTDAEMQSLFVHRGGARLGFRQYTAEEIANNPQLRDVLERGQRYMQLQIDEVQDENGQTVYRVQRRTQGTVSDQNFAVPEPNTILGVPLTGEDARNMRGSPAIPLNPEYGINRRRNNEQIEQRSRTTNVALPGQAQNDLSSVDPQADVASGTAGLTEGPESAFYRGDPDTSAALTATPEMRMIEETIRSEMERANINARYGNSEQAQVHFANALQGQAALLQQERLVMLRAATQGHRSALADLLGLYSGRPEGTTRLVPTGERQERFHIEVLNNEGQWISATSSPLTMGQLVERAEFLVDRESVMARSEANSEIIRANIAAGADIQVAQINALSDEQDRYVRAAIANADNITRERIARGEGRLIVDSTNNRAYYEYQDPNTGEPIVMDITRRRERVADSNGQATEERTVAQRVTGMPSVRGN